MKRMKTKDHFLTIVGTWDGTNEGPVIDYLTEKGYTFKVQVGGNLKWGIEELDAEVDKKARLVVLGDGVYEQWTIEKGHVLTVDDADNLRIWDVEGLDANYEDV